MTTSSSLSASPARSASSAWAAIASGTVGLIAFGILAAGLKAMFASEPAPIWLHRFAMHDVGVVLQMLLLLPVAAALSAMGRGREAGASRATFVVGACALVAIAACLLLDLAGTIWDTWYMLPEGVLGAWLLVVVRRARLSRGLVWFAAVVGVGLLLVGSFPPLYAVLVNPAVLRGPLDPLAPPPAGTDSVNVAIHIVLQVGTLLGVATLPIFSLLLGRSMLRDPAIA